MKSRGTIILGIIVAATGLFILFTLNRSPFGGKNTSLAVPAEKEITKIELSDEAHNLVINKATGSWLINGRVEARKGSIIFITRILHEMTIKSPVSPELFEKEITSNGIKPVRVRVYGNRRLLSDFLVYKTASNLYGNIMKRKNRSKPFIFHVPGHDNDIGSVFTVNELYWQPYTVFNLMPSEIASVSFENLSDTSNSFMIRKEGGSFKLSDGHNALPGDSSMVMRYLSYFTFIPFESWALELEKEKKNEITGRQPLYLITVTTVKPEKIRLTLWEKFNDKNEPDSDRLYGKTENSDEIFIMRYFDLDPILKKRGYFLRN